MKSTEMNAEAGETLRESASDSAGATPSLPSDCEGSESVSSDGREDLDGGEDLDAYIVRLEGLLELQKAMKFIFRETVVAKLGDNHIDIIDRYVATCRRNNQVESMSLEGLEEMKRVEVEGRGQEN